MTDTTFIHLADVHLDSPLASIRQLDEQTANRLQRASRRSLEAVVETALDREVAAVLIAGDLFDAPVKDAGAGLWVESQFKRLTRAAIPVVLIRGNHDALSNASRVIRWSDDIIELGSGSAESVLLDQAGIAVHGQSFGARAEAEDLAASYPAAKAGYFNVGLLHTSLAGSSQHGNYAPTSLTVLEGLGYAYWALGHIHTRSEQSLSQRCYIGYSGNTQGRHIRECGAKGCQLVEVRDGHLNKVEFVATDSVRWHELKLDISQVETLADIEDLLPEYGEELAEHGASRSLAVRLRLSGATKLHAQLTQSSVLTRLNEALAGRLADMADIWLESIKVNTRPPRVAATDGLMLPLRYLCQTADTLRKDETEQAELLGVLDELLKKSRSELSEIDWPFTDPRQQQEQLLEFIRCAEDLLMSRLQAESER